MKPHFHIALALIWQDGKILAAQRRDDADHLPGVWEFPGGKCHDDETPIACVVREVREEIGVEVAVTSARAPIEFDYPERCVTLHPFDCALVDGEAQPLQCAAVRWLAPDELAPDDFPPANVGLIAAIRDEHSGPAPAVSRMDEAHPAWLNWLWAYFERTRSYSTRRFIVELALIGIPFKALFALPLLIPLVLSGQPIPTTTSLNDHGDPVQLFMLGCVLAPLLETFLGQWIPIRVAWCFTQKRLYLLTGSALFFAAQHLYAGPTSALGVFPVAVLLSWGFLRYRERSRWAAYGVTTAIHALHNLVALLAYWAMDSPQSQ